MPDLALGLMIGEADADTHVGPPPPPLAGGFNIDLQLLHATIVARSGDEVGTIAYGTDTYDLYVYDGSGWQIYYND